MTIHCMYLHDGRCQLAEAITSLPKVPVCPDRCEKCQAHRNPMAPNGIIAIIALCAVNDPQEKAQVKAIVAPYIERTYVDSQTGKPVST